MNDLLARLEIAPPKDERGLLKNCARLAFQRGWITVGQNCRMRQFIEAGAFIDAAMTLVPEGWRIAEMKDGLGENGSCELRLWCPNNYALGHKYPAYASTPALAISIAALKAWDHG